MEAFKVSFSKQMFQDVAGNVRSLAIFRGVNDILDLVGFENNRVLKEEVSLLDLQVNDVA